MIRRLSRAPVRILALALPIAACDDGTVITHVDKLSHVSAGDLVVMQEADGLRVEVHGIPWKGATDDELASRLKAPSGQAQEVRFTAVPPGQWVNGRGHRLVLHFNPNGPPNSQHDCRATAEMRTGVPTEVGFTVNATFCTQDQWIAHGYLQATKTEPGDWAEYTRVMEALFLNILAQPKDQ